MKEIAKGFGAEFVALIAAVVSLQQLNLVLEFVLLVIGNASAIYGLYVFFRYGEKRAIKKGMTIDEVHRALRNSNKNDENEK
jgi:hypothetical protein